MHAYTGVVDVRIDWVSCRRGEKVGAIGGRLVGPSCEEHNTKEASEV